jgi:hypothetical protein
VIWSFAFAASLPGFSGLPNLNAQTQFDGHFILPHACSTHAAALKLTVLEMNSEDWRKNEKENCFKVPEGLLFKQIARVGDYVEVELLGSHGGGSIASRGRVWLHKSSFERHLIKR